MILLTAFVAPRLWGQTCDCSSYPTYKCIKSAGRTLDQLIDDGDLEDYDDAPGTAQYIVVEDEISFHDPGDPRPYVFASGSQIVLLPGAGMSVRKEVVFNQVNMTGCATPWLGIQVYPSGRLRLIGSLIAQACEGIILSPNSMSEIIQNTFINNGICIQASGKISLLGKGIAHNTFDGNNYSITPCYGVSVRSAIVLNNIPHITIGNPSGDGDPNEFINYFGISATNSNIDVYNSTFKDRPEGAGILLRGVGAVYTANIRGLGSNATDSVFIENYRVGIDARNYNLKVENASFLTASDRGMIRVAESPLPSILTLSNNRFTGFTLSAIDVSTSTFWNAQIKENKFFDNNDLSFLTNGIRWIKNQVVGANSVAEISDNHFFDEEKVDTTSASDHYHNIGINVNTSSKLRIEYNNFYQNYDSEDEHTYQGIWLNASPDNMIRSNLFLGNYGPSQNNDFYYRGIDAWESGNNLVACNYVGELDRGFRFQGPACDKTTFRHNTMEYNQTGLYLVPGTILGPQFEHENKWPGNLPGNGIAEAHFDGAPGQGLVFMSRFSINSPNPGSKFWADPRIPADDWFVDSNGEEGDIEHCYRTLPLPPTVSDELSISGDFEAYKSYPASEWEAELRAFGSIDENPGLLAGATPEAEFYNERDTANLGKLYRAMKDWAGIGRLTTGFETAWGANATAIAYKLDTVTTWVAAMEVAADTAREPIALALDALYEDMAELQEDNESLADEYLEDVADRADQLALDLENITAEETWEQNLKSVLLIFTERLLDTEESAWDTAHYETLLSIAGQCRHEGGIGVVLARAAIEQFDYDDEDMCPGFSEERISAVSAVGRLKAEISPNPAADRCHVVFDRLVTGTLVVRNLHGQAVLSASAASTSAFDLDTGYLPVGLYMLEAHVFEGRQFLARLAVVR